MTSAAPEKSLRQVIVDDIRARGPIPFSRYMELCLYHPQLGYYSRAKEQFGKAGDFYTSSDVHAVFGRLMARQFDEMWRAMGSPARVDLIEFGPGRGLFAQDVMDWSIEKFPQFADALHYTLVEQSARFRARLEERFAERIARHKLEVWGGIDDFRGNFDDAIFFANEFFDAFPVEIVTPEGQLHVAEDNGVFRETFTALAPDIHDYLDRYSVRPEAGERVEVPLRALDYARRLASIAKHGFCVFVDYGYTRSEQLAGRHRDTLKAFRQHTMSANPYEAPGEQDLTSDVNFTALAAAMHGWNAAELLTQSQFLLGLGEHNEFADAFANCRLPQEHAKVALQLKHLVTPAGMGESFHVLVLSRGVEAQKAASLAGVSFARR
jgi:SAM-dependent MidA family methyltransferase